MNGAEHYHEAELLVSYVTVPGDEDEGVPRHPTDIMVASAYFALAQVHATLALAAATVDNGNGARNDRHATDWNEAMK